MHIPPTPPIMHYRFPDRHHISEYMKSWMGKDFIDEGAVILSEKAIIEDAILEGAIPVGATEEEVAKAKAEVIAKAEAKA